MLFLLILEGKSLDWSSPVSQNGRIDVLRFSSFLFDAQAKNKAQKTSSHFLTHSGFGFRKISKQKPEKSEKYNFSARLWSTSWRHCCCRHFDYIFEFSLWIVHKSRDFMCTKRIFIDFKLKEKGFLVFLG